MTETRTTSSTGGQKGVKAERHDLIPSKGVAAIARVFAFGAEKYADHNWRRGYEWGKSIAALVRHVDDFVDGKTYDLCPDDCEYLSETGDRTCRNHSGLHHLAHAGFHILVLLTWHEEQGEGADNLFDDRWPHSMARARILEAYEGGHPMAAMLEEFGVSQKTFIQMLEDHFGVQESEDQEPPTQAEALAFGLPIPMPPVRVEFHDPAPANLRTVEEFNAETMLEPYLTAAGSSIGPDLLSKRPPLQAHFTFPQEMFNGYTPPTLEM